jgi:hypothetical protein
MTGPAFQPIDELREVLGDRVEITLGAAARNLSNYFTARKDYASDHRVSRTLVSAMSASSASAPASSSDLATTATASTERIRYDRNAPPPKKPLPCA